MSSSSKSSSSFASNLPMGKLGIVAALAFAALLRYRIDFFICLLPKYVDGYFVHLFWSKGGKNNIGPVRVPMLTKVPYYEEPLKSTKDVFDPHGYPRLIKDFAVVDHDKAVNILYKENAGRSMRMLDTLDLYKYPHFSPSCNVLDTTGRIEVQFDDFAKNHLFTEVANNSTQLYAGFESITDPEVLDDLLGVDIKSMGDYKQNNLFASNFKEETIAAALHCAPIDSVSIQLIGTKTWYFVSPQDLAKVQSVPMPTAFNLPMTDDELLSAIDYIHVAVQKPGDLVYFGPNWCHAVSTAPGPNLMFNLRFFAQSKLMAGPKSLGLKIVARLILRTFGGRPQDNTILYPVLYEALSNGFMDDCGISSAWTKLTRQAKALDTEK